MYKLLVRITLLRTSLLREKKSNCFEEVIDTDRCSRLSDVIAFDEGGIKASIIDLDAKSHNEKCDIYNAFRFTRKCIRRP